MAKRDSSQDTKKPRRAKGDGGLFQRQSDGKWVGRITIGRDQKTGQPIRKTVYGNTKAETKKKLTELQKIYDGANYVDAEKITVGEWLNKWLDLYASPPNVAATTHEWYERLLNLYLIPNLGTIRIHKLQGLTIQKMLNDMTKEEQPAGLAAKSTEEAKPDKKKTDKKEKESKPRPGAKSARTVKAVYTILSMALTVAVNQGLLGKSPASAVTVPQVVPKQKRPLTPSEWDALLTAAQAVPDMFAAIVVEWATGVRRSELLALKWEDVDLTTGQLIISKSIKICNAEHGGVTVGATKTQASMRLLQLVPEAVTVLKTHKKEQAAAQLAAGETWTKTGFVFVTATGAMWDPRRWSKVFKTIATAAGIDIGVHTLRHDMSSRLASQNIPIKEAQYQLGHTTVTMLLDTYAHRMQGDHTKVTEAIRQKAPSVLLKIRGVCLVGEG